MSNGQESYALKEVIEEIRSGDRDAFRELFDHINERLFAYALSHIKGRAEALDLVQETFIDLWDALSSEKFVYRSDETFYGFVFIILKRKLTKEYGRERKAILLGEVAIEEGFETEHEDYRHLLSHIDALSPADQEILKLRYWSEMSFNEIAAILHITETAAKVRHHRALRKLKSSLKNK